MSKLKKILLMVTSSVVVAAVAIGGTLAYLKDSDSAVNVMTTENVSIAQHEYERVLDKDGNPVKGVLGEDFTKDYGITESYKLQKFTQAKPAFPVVYTNDKKTTAWDEFQQLWNQVGAPGSNDLFDDSMKNVIDKFVFVENTGSTNAYYRTIIAIESPEGLEEGIIHLNFNSNSRFNAVEQSDDFTGEADKGSKSYMVGYTTIDGVRYALYDMTYNQILTPGEISRPSLLQVYLDPKTENEDVDLFGDTWDILAVSQAVQATGFADADTALDEAFGDITVDNHPWSKVATEVATVNDLEVALAAGKDVKLAADISSSGESIVVPGNSSATLDLNGKTITNTVVGAPAIVNYGELTITGEGAIANGTNSEAKSHTIRNYGTLTINGGNIGTDDTAGAAVVNDGTVTINGGTFASRQEDVKSEGRAAYVFINNGKGTMTINDATFNGQTHGLFAAYAGELIVNGGTYTLDGNGGLGCYVVYASEGTVTLNGGTINTNSPRNGNVFYVYADGKNHFNAAAVETGKVVVNDEVTICLDGVEQSY